MVGGAFQSIDCICFCVNREEVNPELLLKISPGLDRENASVHFLMKHVFGPLSGIITFEEHESPENPFFFIVELLRGQADVEGAGVQECMAVVIFSAEVWRTGELGTHLSRCQSGGGDTGEDSTGGGGVFGMGREGGLATSCVSCCS